MQQEPVTQQTSGGNLVDTVIGFCRALRERGLAVTPGATVDAVRILGMVDLADRRELYLSLRTLLALKVEGYETFDEVFAATFGAGQAGVKPARQPRSHSGPAAFGRRADVDESAGAEAATARSIATAQPGTERDLRGYAQAWTAEIERAAREIARRLATKRSRRWEPARRGTSPDRRRVMAAYARSGGDAVRLRYRRRRIRKTRLVVICDVSGSMQTHARFLLAFLYAAQDAFARVETFVFDVSLRRVTASLRAGSFTEALERIAADVGGFSGGTRIGGSLAAFVERWPALIGPDTVVIIMSDGWDTGEPEVLDRAMRAIRRRARRVIWLNPLLAEPAYRPLTRGMQAALPHVDVFAPAHDLDSLRSLARHLS